MQPMQFSSCAVYIGNQPILLGAVRYAKTSTGQTARQKPHALHMSSPTTTSHRPAGPFDARFSALNSMGLLVPADVQMDAVARRRIDGHLAGAAQRLHAGAVEGLRQREEIVADERQR